MSKKKGAASSRNGRDSNSQRLGVKRFSGETVTAGTIIIRQRGTKYHPAANVSRGKDDTLFSNIAGFVKYSHKKLLKFDGRLAASTMVSVLPLKK